MFNSLLQIVWIQIKPGGYNLKKMGLFQQNIFLRYVNQPSALLQCKNKQQWDLAGKVYYHNFYTCIP